MPGLLAPSAAGVVATEPDEARASAAQATRCATQRKKVKTFKRTMAAKRKAFFKRHAAPKRRRAFVKKQRARLKTLQRRLARCLKPPARRAGTVGLPAGSRTRPSPTPAPTPIAGPSALDSIADVVSDDALVAAGEISLDGAAEIVRTQLELDLAPGASKAAFDALLARIGARVVSSVAGVGLPTVRIPDPGSLEALKGLAASLSADPVLDGADLVAIPPPGGPTREPGRGQRRPRVRPPAARDPLGRRVERPRGARHAADPAAGRLLRRRPARRGPDRPRRAPR